LGWLTLVLRSIVSESWLPLAEAARKAPEAYATLTFSLVELRKD
jgi:hypothetical protein